MISISNIRDPVTMNWRRQMRVLLSKLPPDSPYSAALQRISSSEQLLDLLSQFLFVPSLTLLVADAFRPILLELCSRWLDDGSNVEDKFIALSLLLQPHEELFYVFIRFLRQWIPQDGPLALLTSTVALTEVTSHKIHALLVAYYRILRANRVLPHQLFWSPSYLSKLFFTPHPDRGVRLLAIRCYSLQAGMGEEEREKLEKQILGELCEENCPISFGEDINGVRQEIDGWVLPVVEEFRLDNARNALVQEPHDYYTTDEEEAMEALSLSPRTANIHGLLFLRGSADLSPSSSLIHTATAIDALREISLRLSARLPVLLTSPPSSGKSLLLSYLASTLYPKVPNQLLAIHLADTSLDPRSLLGSYVSSLTSPGTFEWREGVLVRAMKEGKWIVFKDIDHASMEVLGIIKPLVESLAMGKWVGGRAAMNVPNFGRVEAVEDFAVFATRSATESPTGKFAPATFFGSNKFHEVTVHSPTFEELRLIIDSRFPRLSGLAARAFIHVWETVRILGSAPLTREIGIRELEKFCSRLDDLLPSSYQPMDVDQSVDEDALPLLSAIFPNPSLREEMYLEARDVFFGIEPSTPSARSHNIAVAAKVGEELGLAPERCEWVLKGRTPELDIEKDMNGQVTVVQIGRTRLAAKAITRGPIDHTSTRPFAMHRPAVLLLSRIATAVSLREPVLLTGETGTGKTSVVTYLSHLLRRPLISLNLSHQTESSDLIGGFRPVDARVPAYELQERFTELFGLTFSRKKNSKFEEAVRKAVSEAKWKRAVGLWKEAVKMAKERMEVKGEAAPDAAATGDELDSSAPRKRRKTQLNTSLSEWEAFYGRIQEFDVQFVQSKGKFTFAFAEGPLVKALRSGDWILLDEVNLASSETLECISSLLHDPNGSITLTEQGELEPIPRHPDFRLFACMNPATDVGKKDLPPAVRSRFTEIQVSPPDADRDTLLSIVSQYIGSIAVGDKAAIMDVAEYFTAMKKVSEGREVADGSNHRPHYSMRTLARALTFASDMMPSFGLRRALWEGCLMAFTMVLNGSCIDLAISIAQKHLLAGVKNPRSLLAREPVPPRPESASKFVKFGPFYLEKGHVTEEFIDDYIITPSVEKKLIDLARIITTRRFPVLIEGPTSSGKTSSIEYLARRTGHQFVRINNHEHTDIQEYLGTYSPDPETGKLVFKDGLLIHALRHGHWIVLDELNLAPTDVLEALNRLLDDNRELMISETQEVVRPHPNFMLFATQNPPGLYAGRKVLSRAFRNRFLEVHFEDVPQTELETILCQRCRIAPSYGQRIVAVFRELQKRRQSSRVFESKHGFATLRDLFRWAGRSAIGYQELAEDGYMLLAERARREDDKLVVKEVIESIMKVTIDEKKLYNLDRPNAELTEYLGCSLPSQSGLIWTGAMRRLFVLLCRALKYDEPVLLVGETGSGKTSVCQVYAKNISKRLHTINCHLNTETADLIGGLRPVRNRASSEARVLEEVAIILRKMGITESIEDNSTALSIVDALLRSSSINTRDKELLRNARHALHRATALFEWNDGPLVHAMKEGEITLLDEISLADDSVLERLNSVLEPSRTLVLAERGGDDLEQPVVRASDNFKLVATMNPGGDYGKKELSPALRNRFTEIWVPPIVHRHDLEQIVHNLWCPEELGVYTAPLLDFAQWLSDKVGDKALFGLRDLLAWTSFMNSAYHAYDMGSVQLEELFHHAAHMTILDGLASLPQVSSHSSQAIQQLKEDAITVLQSLVPLPDNDLLLRSLEYNRSEVVQFGSFTIPKGSVPARRYGFNLQAPTTLENAMRVVRACQLPKPILLEGSPGVGKTSLITALANICGYKLYRINFSDQSDLIDLLGSDLPVEGGRPGEFIWKDADFLKAMQEGSWVLLDEMNLAPQAVLEGLNAVLDHRGTVFIPELGRTFSRHPQFRIFAAQNPLHQGGGRKGLPKSFLNRFTKVYVEELSRQDLFLICKHIFPDYPPETLQAMISYNSRINEEVTLRRTFGMAGSPWEFNLRDVVRWGQLLQGSNQILHPIEHLQTIYLQRFRSQSDSASASALFEMAFDVKMSKPAVPRWSLAPGYVRIGHAILPRYNSLSNTPLPVILPAQLTALETIGSCLAHAWLIILTGARDAGKSTIIRLLSALTGNSLHEVAVNNATDISDILGSFEQDDQATRARNIAQQILSLLYRVSRTSSGALLYADDRVQAVIKALLQASSSESWAPILQSTPTVLDSILRLNNEEINLHVIRVRESVDGFLRGEQANGRFVWVDGPLVQAMKSGHWILLDGANLCSPSVLDRLNSLCEPGGVLTLNEKGQVNGEVETIAPHPHFRLFMSVDSHYGELSRAMRNRGIEVSLPQDALRNEKARMSRYFRIPELFYSPNGGSLREYDSYEAIRRGIHSVVGLVAEVDPSYLAGSILQYDSRLASVINKAPLKSLLRPLHTPTMDALPYFLGYTTSPSYHRQYTRALTSLILPLRVEEVQPIESLVHRLTSGLHRLHSYLVDRMSVEWENCPLELLTAESIDIFLNHTVQHLARRDEDALVREATMDVLHLFGSLHRETLYGNRDRQASDTGALSTSASAMESGFRESRALQQANALVGAITALAYRIVETYDPMEWKTISHHVKVALQLQEIAWYLRKAINTNHFNYSAANAVIQWIKDVVHTISPVFVDVVEATKALESTTATSVGSGLTQIWSSLLGIQAIDAELLNANDVLCDPDRSSTEGKSRCYSISSLELTRAKDRASILPILAMWSMVSEFSANVDDISISLLHRLQKQTSTCNEDSNALRYYSANPSLLLRELDALIVIGMMEASKTRRLNEVQDIIDLCCFYPGESLLRLLPYQRAVWAADAGQLGPSVIAAAQKEWLQALWLTSFENQTFDDPSILFRPVQLYCSILQSRTQRRPLSDVKTCEESIRRQKTLVLSERSRTRTRLSQMIVLQLQSIAMIAACFQSTSDIAARNGLQDLLCHLEGNTHGFTQHLVSFVEGSDHVDLQASFQRHLRRILVSLCDASQSRSSTVEALGRGWIGLSRAILDLYVPEIPLDPAAIDGCTMAYLQDMCDILSEHINLQIALEDHSTGQDDNAVISNLKDLLEGMRNRLAKDRPRLLRNDYDTSRVHALWSEVWQFQTQVLVSHKIDVLICDIISLDSDALMREQVLQESIHGFHHRLETTYPELSDIVTPLQLALLYMRLGLRVIVESSRNSLHVDGVRQLALALVMFPSVRSAENTLLLPHSQVAGVDKLLPLLTKLAATVVDVSAGTELPVHLPKVDVLYDQICRLWLIERAKEEEAEKASDSLYKHKDARQTTMDEVELQAAEFQALFPDFDNVFESDLSFDMSERVSTGPNSSHIHLLLDVHGQLFMPKARGKGDATSIFLSVRRQTLSALMLHHYGSLPETLDEDSLHYQLALVQDNLESFSKTSTQNQTLDFYRDPNIPEAQKAFNILSSLRDRLTELIEEWPDQMVLQHLKTRCDLVLDLDIDSSVAKMLSALEQLLLQSEDWEMYSNRENTLKSHRQALTGLIVEWRRYELSNWQKLLESQAAAFEQEASQWWFRLYEAGIQGVLSLVNEPEKLDGYLQTLVQLFDEFLTSSPVGQFERRMDLLQSFVVYADLSASRHMVFSRVHTILFSTWRYFSQFSGSIRTSFEQQRSTLEKDINNFIKLASWKDVNVHALKQSAKKTHHQLYKTVRKFRDILRQPVTPHLQAIRIKPEDSSENKRIELLESSSHEAPFMIFSRSLRSVCPEHLVKLDRTLLRFDTLVNERFNAFVRSHSANSLDDMATDVIAISQDLAAISIPENVTGDKRVKHQKALLVRKRKAWSDLLRELKRMGFNSNVKPEVLSRQRDRRWMREQPILHAAPEQLSVHKIDYYLDRLYTLLPQLRECPANHSPDLTTRDLQKAIGFLESALALALHSRTRLASALQQYLQLVNICQRLHALPSAAKVERLSLEGLNAAVWTHGTLSKLTSALDELLREIQASDTVNNDCREAISILSPKIQNMIESTKILHTTLTTTLANARVTIPPSFLPEERRHVEDCSIHLQEVARSLESWGKDAPQFRYLFTSVLNWLISQPMPQNIPMKADVSHTSQYSPDSVIESLLIQVQDLLQAIPASSPLSTEEDEPNMYAKCRLVCDITSSLKFGGLLDKLSEMLSHLLSASKKDMDTELSRLLPFLDRYMCLVRNQLMNHSYWTKTLLKFDFILCNIVYTVSTQGFCQPPECEEDTQGGDPEVDESGVGLGQGSGAKDVSDQIDDESQVEGLQGEEPQDEENDETGEKAEGMEMENDLEGELEDVSDHEDEDNNNDEAEQEDLDEQTGNLDASDPSAVDEKLWGDDDPKDSQADQKSGKNLQPEQQGNEEMMAKEEDKGSKPNKDDRAKEEQQEPAADAPDELQPGNDEELPDETSPDASGAPMDEHVREGDALDLPDDMDLGPEEKPDAGDSMGDEDDDMLSEEGEDAEQDVQMDSTANQPVSPEPEKTNGHSPLLETDRAETETEAGDEHREENAVARPDLHAGDGSAQDDSAGAEQGEAPAAQSEAESGGAGTQGSVGKEGGTDEQPPDKAAAAQQAMDIEAESQTMENSDKSPENAASSNGIRRQGTAPSEPSAALANNPLRNLGEAIKEIQRRFADILESSEGPDAPLEQSGDTAQPSQVEHLRPDDEDQDMQALGPTAGEEAAKLSQLNILDEEQQREAKETAMDVDEPIQDQPPRSGMDRMDLHAEPNGEARQRDIESAITSKQIHSQDVSGVAPIPADASDPKATQKPEEDLTPAQEEELSAQTDSLLQTYLSDPPHDHETAQSLWIHYSLLTSHLSSILCEQLRLILEPTRATRLKGDYRTGKRLNMKKIIPYIASEYTKDKIWLRRTRPSEREYHVLLALDDSRSMRESRSVGLAFKTLALVTKALGKLEVGEVGIAKFGENVEVLQGFGSGGPLNDAAGARVVEAFTFGQKATDMLKLVETSLKVLEEARERKMGAGGGSELWQLEIIISDGICQDHEKLRRVLRRAQEMKVMFVFVVLDSLHTQSQMKASGSGSADANASSILSMNQVSYKTMENGKMELTMERYLDSFPFEYYVVLRDVEALPEVLSGTLKQFFERVSEE